MHRKKRRRLVAGLTAVVCVVAVCVCVGLWRHAQQAVPAYMGDAGTSQGASSEQPPSSEPQPAQPVSIHMLAVGDNLIHDSIYEQANARTGGSGYDFKPVYSRVRDLLRSADIGVINQETVLAERFSSLELPAVQLADRGGDAVVTGFDVVNHANNHVLDKGVDGKPRFLLIPRRTSASLAPTATTDLQNIRIVERGIKTAHIGVTQWLNGLSCRRGRLPPDPCGRYRADKTSDYQRKELSDVVVVSCTGALKTPLK
ncbi:MAG: CapA family protein [Oscillospiraceae bacterium]